MDIDDLEMVWIWAFIPMNANPLVLESNLGETSKKRENGSGVSGTTIIVRHNLPEDKPIELWIGPTGHDRATLRWKEELRREKILLKLRNQKRKQSLHLWAILLLPWKLWKKVTAWILASQRE
jgi:hypothetical protein